MVIEGKLQRVLRLIELPGVELKVVKDKLWENTCTFYVQGEDHTLGNVLAEEIMHTQEREGIRDSYVAYQKKHPLENELEVRVKTGQHGDAVMTPQHCFQQSCRSALEKVDKLGKSLTRAIKN